jgi:hypothetical protein
MLTLSNRRLVAAAIICNCLIIGLCFAMFGINAEGAGSATRNTGRFAMVFFLARFAAPGLANLIVSLPKTSSLIYAFVAAQMVHFGSVAVLHTLFAKQPLSLSVPLVAIVASGFSIVAAAGLTVDPHPQFRFYTIVHIFTIYGIFLILAADYLQHPVKPLRVIAVPVLASLLLRHLPRRRQSVSKINAAQSVWHLHVDRRREPPDFSRTPYSAFVGVGARI